MSASLGSVLVLGLSSFAVTNVDNAITAAAQQAAVPAKRRSLRRGQLVGNLILILGCWAVAAALGELPTWSFAVLAVIPAWFCVAAIRVLRHPAEERRVNVARATTAALVTIAAGGDNLAVYLPLLRRDLGTGALTLVLTWCACAVALVWLATLVASHPKVEAAAERVGHYVLPIIYAALVVLILAASGVL